MLTGFFVSANPLHFPLRFCLDWVSNVARKDYMDPFDGYLSIQIDAVVRHGILNVGKMSSEVESLIN